MTLTLITLMISFGFISSDLEFESLDQVQQERYLEIIIDDVDEL